MSVSRRLEAGLRTVRRSYGRDPFLLPTITLTPVVLAVAIASRRPGDIAVAVVLSVVAVGLQFVLGRWPGRLLRRRRGSRTWARIAVPLVYVGLAVQLVGGPALPLLALFIPIVAGAAALGPLQAWVTAIVATVIYLLPEVGNLGSPAAVAIRGVTLSGVSLILAFGVRRMVRALQAAVREARLATAKERRRSRQLGALHEVGNLLASAGPSTELLERTVQVLARGFDYPHASIYLGDESHVSLVAQYGYPEALAGFDPGAGVAGRVMRTREIALVGDVTADADYVPGTIPATSLICAPLIVDDRFLGVLNVETSGARRLDMTDRTLMGILATRIATSVALGRDRQALAERAELFRDVEQFGRDVSASLAIDTLATVILEALGRVVPADILAVTLLDPGNGRYTIRAVRGIDSAVLARSVQPGVGLAGRAIRDRNLVMDAIGQEGQPPWLDDMDVPALSCGVGLPLLRDAVVVGALTVGRTADEARFSDLELEGLQLLASHAALAVANAFLHREVEELAIRDGLTGLYNRRYFDETLERMLAQRQRERLSGWRPLSAIVFDLDHFGAFNKEHGHQVGDGVLRAFSDVLRARFRSSDLVARLGGEEFIAVLDGAGLERAVAAANDVRERLSAQPLTGADGHPLAITVSAGCAELDPAAISREELLRTADVALFMAKRAGRDRVVAA